MYKIGEFSRITGLSVKTLRYYHDEGLLIPDEVDPASGYRYYFEDAVSRATQIRQLRELDFSLEEILEVLSHCNKEEDLYWYLSEKSQMLQERIAHYNSLKKRITAICKQKEMNRMSKVTIVELVEREPIQIASLRYKGRYDDCGTYFSKLFGAAKGAADGPSMCVYHNEEYRESDADIECCVPLKKAIGAKNVDQRTLPGGKHLKVVYTGPYEEIGQAYHELLKYAAQNTISLGKYSIAVYVKGPGMLFKGNPNDYVTEVLIPLENA